MPASPTLEEYNAWPEEDKEAFRLAENARLDALIAEQEREEEQLAEVPWVEPVAIPFNAHVDGLVGEIADWITATAFTPQPLLSLAAALAFMGMAKSHRVKGHTNFRTNIYCLAMAPTGGGKEHPETCIDNLAEACGLGKYMMGEPTSGTGLLTGLTKSECRGLLALDEVGRYVGHITSKSAGSYQKEIGDLFVKLFSKAGRKFRGRQYGNEKENPQAILQQPSLSILGSSVPERLQAAVTSADMVDGFLNRWIAFHAPTRPPMQKGVRHAPPPEELVKHIVEWLEANPTNSDNYGCPHPKEMRFTEEAYEKLVAYKEEMRGMIDKAIYPVNQLYVRSAEHAEKIAMIITDGDIIGTHELEKAIEIVSQSNITIAAFARGVSDSPHDAAVFKVLEIIRKSPGGVISRRDITRSTQSLELRKRNDILFQLIESEEIEALKDGKSVSYRYIL